MLNPNALRQQADSMLRRCPADPKKLVLLHAAVALGSAFVITALNFLLGRLIADTGGLSGLGMRSVLSTVQTLLELALAVALPFWEIGLVYAALGWARGNAVGVTDLMQGFRRCGAVLVMRLLQGWVFFFLGSAVFYFSSMVFLATPFSKPLLEIMEPMIGQELSAQQLEEFLTPELLASAAKVSTPLLVIFGCLFAVAALPLFYRLRFADLAVMDGHGPVKSLLGSVHLTRRHTWQLVRLDLSFWRFYLLQALCVAISYADTLLPALGVSLPLDPQVAFFLFYFIGAGCQFLLLWQYQAHVVTAYGVMYDHLSGHTALPGGDSPAAGPA